jgi:CheY-like chemotaxis protein
MLAYSGKGRFLIQRLDLGKLVEETAQMLKISISKKATLRFHLEEGLPHVEVDSTQIHQVVMNLVINASEAIGDRTGVITISTGLARVDRDSFHGTLTAPDLPEGNYVFLEVADDGCGMDPETKGRIFDPFFTTKFTGRGLGLAAVLGIVRGHKGALKVTSEVGRGSTFRILFPHVPGTGESHKDAPKHPPTGHAKLRGKNAVLVVDDEETVRSTLVSMLEFMELDVVLAANGQEALDLYKADPGRFSMVLLDLTMPHMDGQQTFAELRRIRPDVRVVLMSGFSENDALDRFSGEGPESFLQKPFRLEALRDVLQDVLG